MRRLIFGHSRIQHGLGYDRAPRMGRYALRQKGRGIGNFFSSIARFAKPLISGLMKTPIVKRGVDQLKASALKQTKGFLSDVVGGKSPRLSAQQRMRGARDEILSAVFDSSEQDHASAEAGPPAPKKVKRSQVKRPINRATFFD